MKFKFKPFASIVESVYDGGPYDLGEVLSVFREYFQSYEDFLLRQHPLVRPSEIKRTLQ